MGILQLLASDNFITVNKTLIKKLGLEEAVVFGELCSQHNLWEIKEELREGYFFCTVEKLLENTGLSEYKQRKAINNLKEKGLIEVKMMDLPAKRFIKINTEQVLKFFELRSEKITELEPKKFKTINKVTSNKVNINKSSNNKLLLQKENFELKHNKKPKQNRFDKIVSLINDFTEDLQVRKLLVEYYNLLAEMNCNVYLNQFKGLLNKLTEICNSDTSGKNVLDIMKEVIQQSINKGWKNFYPVTSTTYKPKRNSYVDNIVEEEDNEPTGKIMEGQVF